MQPMQESVDLRLFDVVEVFSALPPLFDSVTMVALISKLYC